MAVYIAFAWGVFLFAAVTLLLSAHGARHDLVRRRVSKIVDKDKRINILDEELNKPLSERFIRTLSSKLKKYAVKSSYFEKDAKNQHSNMLKKMLRQAGMSISVSEYSFIRFIAIAGTAALFGTISMLLGHGLRATLGVLLGFYAGYAFMRFRLSAKISKRRKSMERQLPDVLDLLSVNVEAGLGFEQALLQAIEHFEGPMIEELTVTYREMTMGRPRREALTLLAERCEISEVKTFVSSMIQAEQLGISIKNVLRTQAAGMRTSRRNKVEEKAMKISVKILLPMVGLIFPVLLIVLMGPAALKIIGLFKG